MMINAGKYIADNLLGLVAVIGGVFGLIKILSDYQQRKIAEAKEKSVGAKAIQDLREELSKIEKKIDAVDRHCEERDKNQREHVQQFFTQIYNVLNKR